MVIGVWGDSITFGSCDKEELGWVGRLRRFFPTDNDHYIYNFGICGDSSADVLERFPVEFNAVKPEKTIFAVGINDSKFPHEGTKNLVSLEDYRANMIKLVEIAKRSGGGVVLVGPTSVGGEVRTERRSIFKDSEIIKYCEVLQEVAIEQNSQYVDMFDVLDPKSDLDDGVHPNANGYQKMFEKMKSRLDGS